MLDYLGKGAFGEVLKARHLETQQIVAIKCIKNVFRTEYDCRKVLRELTILRQLTDMDDNLFTPKLVDVVVPLRKNAASADGCQKFNELFLVMEFYSQNLQSVYTDIDRSSFTEDHVLIIMYNLLCAMNYLHSANLLH